MARGLVFERFARILRPGRTGSAPGLVTGALDEVGGPPAAADLDVMTFNLRYASARRPNSWARRRPVVRALLGAERPDLIGTQEGLYRQVRDIVTDLPGRYGYVGAGRGGGVAGEHVAIFYNLARLAVREHQHFWLSDTPEVAGSNTWGGAAVRMVTLGRFVDLRTGGELYVVNTHLDHVSEEARRRAAALIRDRLADLDRTVPVVLTGDFNTGARASGRVYQTLVDQAGFVDAWVAAHRRGPRYGTAHGYRSPAADGPRIDWILTSPGIAVPAAVMNTYRRGDQYPSDHLPVQARLRLPAVAAGSTARPAPGTP